MNYQQINFFMLNLVMILLYLIIAIKTVRVLVIWAQDIMCQMVSFINLNKLNVISPELINS